MRQNIIKALLEKPVEFLLLDEILTATDEELNEALRIIKESGRKRAKQRIDSLQRELKLRTSEKYNCPYDTESAREKFANEWNRVVGMFK